jgi:uncharacterized sulfatase
MNLNRLAFNALAIGSFVLLLLSCKEKQTGAQLISKPNILFAIADDHSFPHTSIYGFPEIATPGFDQVAKNGILFHNAFVAAPQCSPSRAAILTGRNIWQLEEAGTHASSFPKKFPVFTDLLESAGYKIGYTGKPWGPGNWKIEGWERNPVGPEYNQKVVESVPASGINSRDYAGNFSAFLDEKNEGEPFFFWYGGHEPHRVYEAGSGVKAGKNLEKVSVPAFLPDHEITQNDVLDYNLEIEYFDSHLLKMLQLLEEKGELQNTLVVVTADNGMPFPYAKANLQEYGTHVPLAISWPQKINKNLQSTELVSTIDLAPTFLEIVGLPPVYGMTGRSLTKLLYSSAADQKIRDFVLTGRERHTHARPDNLGYPARALRTKDFLLVKNYEPERWPIGDPVPINAENDKRSQVESFKALYPGYHDIDDSPSKTYMMNHQGPLFEMAFGKRPSWQLYDIQKDAECLHDLSQDPFYAEELKTLSDKLDKVLEEQGDPRIFGSEIFDSYPRYSSMRNFEGFNDRGKYNENYK